MFYNLVISLTKLLSNLKRYAYANNMQVFFHRFYKLVHILWIYFIIMILLSKSCPKSNSTIDHSIFLVESWDHTLGNFNFLGNVYQWTFSSTPYLNSLKRGPTSLGVSLNSMKHTRIFLLLHILKDYHYSTIALRP